MRTTRCQVAPPLILSVGRFQSDQYFVDRTTHVDCNQIHLADDGFEALSFDADRPFAADRFQCFLEQLPDHVFRAKGLIWISESDTQYLFHLVGKFGRIAPIMSRLVLIGRNLDRTRLREELEKCLTDRPRGTDIYIGN